MLARWRPCSTTSGELYRRYCANKKENAGRVANYLRTMGTIWRALSRPEIMMMGQIAYLDAYAYAPHTDVPRQLSDVMVESWVREALIRLNSDIAAQPDRADEVIYNLRACILSVRADGLVRANENFMAWLRGEKTMPFGHNGEHVSVRLVDTIQPANNRLTVTNQWTFQVGAVEKRFDVVFVVNGLPLVIGEAKTPTRSAVTWFDGAFQINQIYEKDVPAMFVPNVFSFATEGRLFRYGSIRMPIEMWGPWRDEDNPDEGELRHVQAAVKSMLRPEVVLDILANFTVFATD